MSYLGKPIVLRPREQLIYASSPLMSAAIAQRNLASLLERQLHPVAFSLLMEVSSLANEQGVRAFLVGGIVRDILLRRESVDIDVIIEGNAGEIAKALAARHSSQATTHDQFGTAKLYVQSVTLDLATARTETYDSPGALPRVTPGAIEDDLSRRDFTINAIAMDLSSLRYGEILDPLGGRADLDARLIRTMHEQSFTDDATRMLRALRYQARFGFTIEAETEAQLQHNLPMLDTISGDRIRHELERMLLEDKPELVLALAHEAGVLHAIHPALTWNPAMSRRFARARQLSKVSRETYLAVWGLGLTTADAQAVGARLALPGAMRRPFLDAQRLFERCGELEAEHLPSSLLYQLLSSYDREAIAACRIGSGSEIIEKRLALYLDTLAGTRTSLDGKDLISMGVAQGPLIGEILLQVKLARLDSVVRSKEDEVAFVHRWLADHAPTHSKTEEP